MSLFQAWWITKSPRYIRMSQLVPQCLGCCRTLCSRCFLVAPRGICLRPAFVERKSHRGEALWHRRRWTGRQMNFRKSAEILWGLMMFCRDCINPKKCDPVLFLESLNIDFDCVSNVSDVPQLLKEAWIFFDLLNSATSAAAPRFLMGWVTSPNYPWRWWIWWWKHAVGWWFAVGFCLVH